MNEEILLETNSGFIPEDPSDSDFMVGGETGVSPDIRLSSGNWKEFLPSDERQKKLFDTMACVSFSALNSIEAQINFLIKMGMVPDYVIKALSDLGFFDEHGKFNSSDRFTAKVSGTSKRGNSLVAVWNSIRNYGILPENDWKFSDSFNWDGYYAEIPSQLKEKALEFLRYFDVKYEWVVTRNNRASVDEWKDFLKTAPIQLATAVCSPWSKDQIIAACDRDVNHATLMFNVEDGCFDIFDHYAPFCKRLSLDYPIPFGMRGVVTLREIIPPGTPSQTQTTTNPPVAQPKKFSHKFEKQMRFGERSDEIRILQDALKNNGVFPLTVTSTGYYGNITRLAVLAFQKKHNVASLAELNSLNGKLVGVKTLAKLNELFNK